MSTAASIGPFSLVTSSAQEAVLVANTPSFLLDRLRKDVAVQTVVENLTSAQIVVALREAVTHPAETPSGMVLAYIYLAALSSIDPKEEELWKQISAIDLSCLEWGELIRALILAEAVPTNTLEFSASEQPRT